MNRAVVGSGGCSFTLAATDVWPTLQRSFDLILDVRTGCRR